MPEKLGKLQVCGGRICGFQPLREETGILLAGCSLASRAGAPQGPASPTCQQRTAKMKKNKYHRRFLLLLFLVRRMFALEIRHGDVVAFQLVGASVNPRNLASGHHRRRGASMFFRRGGLRRVRVSVRRLLRPAGACGMRAPHHGEREVAWAQVHLKARGPAAADSPISHREQHTAMAPLLQGRVRSQGRGGEAPQRCGLLRRSQAA